jgi:hypothetical protein
MPLLSAQLAVIFVVSRFLRSSGPGLRFADYLKVYAPFQMCWLLWNMLYVHPFVHTHEKSIYPWPLNIVFQDYEGHVLCHHVSGYCLSSVPFTGDAHNLLLFAHGWAYKAGLVSRLTTSETMLSYGIDVLLFFLIAAYIGPVAYATKKLFAEKKNGDRSRKSL